MIKIDLLKNHPSSIDQLVQIWHQVLASIWMPDVSLNKVKQEYIEHLNDNHMPLTFVAHDNEQPIGMCSLRENDGIRPDLMPWLGSLVVDSDYQNQGVGQQLIEATTHKAKRFNFEKLFLFTFGPTLPNFYRKLGWKKIGTDRFKGHPVTVMEIGLKANN